MDSLTDLVERFVRMRHHHYYICGHLADGVYPPEEAERVGELVDQLAAQISERITTWRDSSEPTDSHSQEG